MNNELIISSSPHIHTSKTVERTMLDVIIALLPAIACSLFFFGVGALVVLATAVAGCVATEFLIQKFLIKGNSTIGNYSAIVTGVLLALNLPSNLPVYIVLLGSVFAIGIAKMAFGGLGNNIFNPAIAGRVFLLLSFPAQMTTWPLPIVNRWQYFDMETGATILSTMKEGAGDVSTGASIASSMKDIVEVSPVEALLGNMGGSMGEALSNTNGTWDLGCFQINTVHVNELAAMGIAPETLLRDGCVNAYAAAWLLRKEYERTGDLWLAIGAYHSRTPHRRDAYIRKVRTNLEELRRRGISSLSSLQEAQP